MGCQPCEGHTYRANVNFNTKILVNQLTRTQVQGTQAQGNRAQENYRRWV